MNLLDILSEESLININNIDVTPSFMNESIDNSEAKLSKRPKDGIYYLPTSFTDTQKELTKIVLKLFKNEFMDILKLGKGEEEVVHFSAEMDNKVDISNIAQGANQKVDIIFDQLKLISKHPSLLVNHIMPKKLLLSQTKENLARFSGIFQFLNRLVDSIISRLRGGDANMNNGEDFNLLVLCQSLKELELVEGLIIGKELDYRRLGSHKLFGDDVAEDHQVAKIDTEEVPKRHKKRRKIREEKRKNPKTSRLRLYLTTTSQIYNNYAPFFENISSKFDLIFSCDSDIDPTIPSIQIIRGNNSIDSLNPSDEELMTPIIVPTPICSLDHFLLLFSEEDSASCEIGYERISPERKISVLKAFVTNFSEYSKSTKNDAFFIEKYGIRMSKLFPWIKNWQNEEFPIPHLLISHLNNKEIDLNFTDQSIKECFDSMDSESIEQCPSNGIFGQSQLKSQEFNIRNFKERFTSLIRLRIEQFEYSSSKLEINLKDEREEESRNQEKIDETQAEIATLFNKLKKLNNDASLSERKLARAESDFSKVNNILSKCNSRHENLRGLLSNQKPKEELEKLLNEQMNTISTLEEEKNRTDLEIERISEDNEKTRALYQAASSEAANLSRDLSSIKSEGEYLKKRLESIGLNVLPPLIIKDDSMHYNLKLQRLQEENKFLKEFYSSKIEKQIRDRRLAIESSGSVSSSRSNTRISRASTPLN